MFTDADIIYSYTRGQALGDGVLIDISGQAREAGLKFPVAITSAAWAEFVRWDDTAKRRKGGLYQDEDGRLWDVVWMLQTRIGQLTQMARMRNDPKPISELEFQFYCVPYEGRGKMPRLSTLKAVIGPGDKAEPVITVMLTTED
jgi:hypothetical protein